MPKIPQRDPKVQEIHVVQIVKMSKLPIVLDVKNPRAPPRDPNVQKIHAIQIAKMSKLTEVLDVKNPRIQRSKRSMLSKLLRDPSLQELPQEVHIIRSQAFPRNCISLYCKRPTIRADEPNVVKANIVLACNLKKVCPTLPRIS